MQHTIGSMRFCRVEECPNRNIRGTCERSDGSARKSCSEMLREKYARDPVGLSSLISLLSQLGAGVTRQMSSDAVVAVFDEHLSSGRFRICQTLAGDPTTTANTPSAQAEKPFPLAQRQQKPQSTSAVSEEPTVFPTDVEQDALAQTLIDGSRSGVPCVEECMRSTGDL